MRMGMEQGDEPWTTVTHTPRRIKKSSKKKSITRSSKSLYPNSSHGEETDEENSSLETQSQNVFNDITTCMQRLQAQNKGFYSHLLESIPRDFLIEEIVCYGIGNFSSSLSASMLQFSCVLLLQRSLSNHNHKNKQNTQTRESLTDDSHGTIPIHFFEPQITPLERMIIQQNCPKVFIIPDNEYGKRKITLPTLFYMPHCPMRLYSNVLYANWESLPQVLIFGNSFAMYDERRIGLPKEDDTNGIWKILPLCTEHDVHMKKGGEDEDVLKHLENAFNDCAVMSFQWNRNALLDLKRPEEYLHQEGDELF